MSANDPKRTFNPVLREREEATDWNFASEYLGLLMALSDIDAA